MEVTKTVFLGKARTIYGPFSRVEIDALKTQGQLESYSWICYDPNEGWLPIVPPPSLEELRNKIHAQSNQSASTIAPSQNQITHQAPVTHLHSPTDTPQADNSISVLCHDRRTVLSGILKEISVQGCTLTQITPQTTTMPVFQHGTRIYLNLVNDHSSKTENVRAIISATVKNRGAWDYQLLWENIPELLKRA